MGCGVMQAIIGLALPLLGSLAVPVLGKKPV